jgi:hypothetical protein
MSGVPCFFWFLSEEEVEDIVIEVVCREEPIELAHWQLSHLVWQVAIGIPVDDRHLVSLDVTIKLVASMSQPASVSRIHDAWIRHLYVVRRLKIYVLRQRLKELLEIKSWGHCKPPQDEE